MTPTDLPTDRLRQMRDGHNPDDGHSGRARAARIAKLQTQIIEADELASELGRYRRVVAATVEREVLPAVGRLVDREVGRMIDRANDYRNRCANELRALQ